MADERGLTLVTVLFDLARREGPGRRSIDEYLRAGQWLLELDRDLVVFADPEVAPEVTRRRVEAGRADRTVVVPVALEEQPVHRLLRQVEAAHVRRPPRGWVPHKDTPRYTILQWARFDLVQQAIEHHVRGDGPVGLIDFGLTARPHPDDDPFAVAPAAGIRLLMMRGFSSALADEPRSFCDRRPGYVAAGFVTGGQAAWMQLVALIRTEIAAALENGLAPTDEHLLAAVAARHPQRFDFHHGDYPDLLRNAVHLRSSAENLAFQLRVAREHAGTGTWVGPSAFELCQRVIGSLDRGILEAEGAELAALLDECFIAAYNWRPGGQALAERVRDLYWNAVRTDGAARDAFLLHEVRMRANFAFLEREEGSG